MKSINVQGAEIGFLNNEVNDYLSLTDLARKINRKNPTHLIINWLRNKDTIEFLGVWEKLNNPDFNPIEFDKIRSEAGYNTFILSSSRWIKSTNAIGIKSKAGRYGGTYAHRDIALGFCYWLSPPFQLNLIKEFQKLKEEEWKTQKDAPDWNLNRILSKINYTIQTDAIREKLIPPKLGKSHNYIYASEAEILNVALFGITTKEWRKKNRSANGNMRDNATTIQLLVLSNMQAINAELIRHGMSKEQRIIILNETAIKQTKSLLTASSIQKLKGKT